jgi:hypothetical protein
MERVLPNAFPERLADKPPHRARTYFHRYVVQRSICSDQGLKRQARP